MDESYSVHLMYCNSALLDMFVYDTLKECCEAGLDSTFEIENTANFNEMLDLMNMQSFMSKRWLFVIKYKKTKKLVERYKGVFTSKNSCFLIKVENYREFLEVKSLIPQSRNDMYLSFLNFEDIVFLLRGYSISDAMLRFISRAYAREPEKIMILIDKMKEGYVVSDKKSVTAVCGESQSTISSYVMSLLNTKIKSELGAKRSLKKKINDGVSLSRIYSPGTLRNYMIAELRNLIHIKQMYLNADIYKEIREVPECFESNNLNRYSGLLDKIIEMPMDTIVKLFIALEQSGRWYKEIDVVAFLYNYYEILKN